MSCIGFVTFSNTEQAKEIIAKLLDKRLIACANLISNVESFYRWKGNIQNDHEVLALLKTNPEKIGAVIGEIEKSHSYELPVIEFINVDKTTPRSQQWVNESVK